MRATINVIGGIILGIILGGLAIIGLAAALNDVSVVNYMHYGMSAGAALGLLPLKGSMKPRAAKPARAAYKAGTVGW